LKVGDLITFKPIGFGLDDWSNPGVVLKEWEPADPNPPDDCTFNYALWCVWVDGVECIVDEKNYDVMYLTSS
tara:strand:- start:103 stop:318 length:216 start_codon:yes stop_codon:yes gene_type:complete